MSMKLPRIILEDICGGYIFETARDKEHIRGGYMLETAMNISQDNRGGS